MSARILVVGAGAVGGYFGGRLAAAGRDVTFLARGRRAEQLRGDGLTIVSPHGDLSLKPNVVTADALREPFDVVLVSVKGYALEGATRDLSPAVGPATVVLPLLNGMRHLDRLVAVFGGGRVIGGLCYVATELDGEGRIVQLADMQRLSYGERDGTSSDRMASLDETFRDVGFEAGSTTAIMPGIWEKWVMLSSLGAACCLLRGSVGDIVAAPAGGEVSRAILDECAAIATACGYPPSASFMAKHGAAMTTEGSPATSSMYRDLRKGAAVESDEIVGDLVRHAVAMGVEAPLLTAAWVSLSVYAERRPRG